jgi:aminoglycoside 6'-N-acetyltransferase
MISFRPLARGDFSLLQRWLAEPHIIAWWRDPSDLASIEAKYLPRIAGMEPTHVYIIERETQSIGWIQWYRWADYPEHAGRLGAPTDAAGIDLAIGEKELLGQGLGPAVIRQFLAEIVFTELGIASVVADPEVENLRSQAAFRKAGFSVVRTVQLPGEDYERHVVRRDRSVE